MKRVALIVLFSLFAVLLFKTVDAKNSFWMRRVDAPPVVLMGPVGQWMLNSTSISNNNTVVDESGNNNTATVVSGPLTFGAMGATFNGTSQYLNNSTINTQGWPELTVAVWFNPTVFTGASPSLYPSLVANSHSYVDNKGFDLHLSNTGAGGVYFDVGNGKSVGRASGGPALSVGVYHLFVGTYDGVTDKIVKVYLDANLVGSAPLSGALGAGGGNINIAQNPVYPGNFFPGQLYDVRIYNRALSDAEISSLYSANTTPVAINFTTNPASITNDVKIGTTVSMFAVVTANKSTYTGTPTGACVTQNPCPFAIGGSTGAWNVKTSAPPPLSNASNLQYTVTAP